MREDDVGWRIYGIGPVYGVEKRGRAPPPPPVLLSFCLTFLSFLLIFLSSFSPSFSVSALAGAFCSADQCDFCLKHDLSLKYLKPDYLWVYHLGRRDVNLSFPLSLALFFAKSDAPIAAEIPRLWNSPLWTWNAFSLSLSVYSYPLLFFFISMKGSFLPSSSQMQWNLTRFLYITADILLSFGHTFLAARFWILSSHPPSLSCLLLTRVMEFLKSDIYSVIATTICILETAQSKAHE